MVRWHAYPEFRGCHGHGIVCVPCDFSDKQSLVSEAGLLKALVIAAGQLVAKKRENRCPPGRLSYALKRMGPKRQSKCLSKPASNS